ncbi:MAG TPA: ASKHA domain-containing protein [Oscillospiraceae bacterium]|nr:ASKHA domain-containing protein [Oscillospiraceae bacterium]
MTKHEVLFPGDLRLAVEDGTTLKEIMNDAGINFDFPCGGRGRCGKCLVRITAGANEPLEEEKKKLTEEQINEGIRFACLTKVHSKMSVEFLSDKNIQHKILLSSLDRSAKVEPHITKRYIEVDKATMTDHRTDWQRIRDGLTAQGNISEITNNPVDVLRTIPDLLRNNQHKITAVIYKDEIRSLEAGNTTEKLYGVAFDIGTTTIAGFLMDLYTGKQLSVASTLNPQTQYGADVISRITHVSNDPDGLADLHRAVTQAINKLIGEAAEKAGLERNDIYSVSIVGNTCMHHLFLGINPRDVAIAPYVPIVTDSIVVDPQDVQLEMNPGGKVFVLPNIAGFVGADTIGVLLATELDESEDIKLVVDIGTNGEMLLGNKEHILACSTAAGPAFEGAQISSGMRGATGAIDHVTFGEELTYTVIDDVEPLGICGSALLDTVAGLVEFGLLEDTGRIMKPEQVTHPIGQKLKDRLIVHDGSMAFLLEETKARKIMVTQKDIRELQLAKAAMAAGIQLLVKGYGIEVGDIQEVLLAGAFGNYLNPHSACVIGLIPLELEDRVKMVGNAAGAGSQLALLSTSEYQRSGDAARNVQFVELGTNPAFTDVFAEQMLFPDLDELA